MISVLHVDDEEYFLDLSRRFLEREGDIRVEGAESAEAALERLREARYDAIISDYQMPGMDGIAFLKQLRAAGDPTPFIILTGRGREQVAIEALNSGADFYLQKGTDPKIQFIGLRNLVLQAVNRRRAVDALVGSEQKYRQLVELAREGIWAIDAGGITTYVNPRMEEMLGYGPGEMSGRHLFSFMDEAGKEIAGRYLERRTRGIKEQHEFEFLRKDGSRIATRLETGPILDASGAYAGALAVVAEITREKEAETALRESEERYRNLAEASQDLIYIIDRDDRVVYLNARALELLGKRKEEVEGSPRAHLFPTDRNETMKAHLAKVFSSGEPVRVESAVPFGERISWLDTTLIPLRCPDGSVSRVLGISRDITERKQIEDALRESEERWKTLFEQSAVPQMLMDGDARVIDCNTAFLELFGLKDRATILGHSPDEFAPPVQPDGTPSLEKGREIQRAFREKGSARYEWAHLKHDAARTPILTEVIGTIVPLRGRDLVHVMVLDITERRRVEDALRESEEKYRGLVERAHEGIIVVQDGIVKFCNRRSAEMWGGECREIVGRPYRDFVDPREFPRLCENYERRMAGKEVPGRYDTRLLRKDGTSFPVDLEGGNFFFGRKPADLIMFRDITDRKRVEEALRESEEKYRTLVERANDGITVVQDGVVKFCNRRAAELWGGVVAEILGRPFQDFIDPADAARIRENYERRMAGHEVPRQYDALLRRKDGSRFHGELNAGAFLFGGRSADLILFRDISERKMAEDALRTVNRKLNLLSSVTRHDMLNQIMVVTGYLELARVAGSLEEARELLQLAGKAAATMRRQVEFTREYEDVGIRSPVWQDLREVIARALPGLGSRVKIQLEISEVRIYADPLLERVFSNLIENALLHGERVTAIRFSARVEEGALSILCEDDGVGIPAWEKEKIFAPGYGRKTGYGLFLVREILGITGATIREIGGEGKGAVFEITVPGDAFRIGG